MKRGRILPWRDHEDEYLTANYSVMPGDAVAFFLGRTMQSVWARASRLGLSKQNPACFKIGHKPVNAFQAGNIPATKGKRTKLRLWERAAALFESNKELTQADIASLLNVPLGSVSGSLAQRPDGLMYIDRWALINKHYVAIYAAGNSKDAPKPNKSAERAEVKRKESKPQPIPSPTSWLWGVPQATDYNQAAMRG